MKVSHLLRGRAITCGAHDTLEHAAQLLWQHDIGCVPVVDEHGRLLGIITDRDICAAARKPADLERITVAAAMERAVCACRLDDDVQDVARRLSERQLRRVPVLDAAGRVVGVVSRKDLARAHALQPVWACAPRSLPSVPSARSR